MEFPTGGRCLRARARERFRHPPEGQQIRSNAGADGKAVPHVEWLGRLIVRMKEDGKRGGLTAVRLPHALGRSRFF